MHNTECLPVVELKYTVPTVLDVIQVRPGDFAYDDYVGHVSEGWCPPEVPPEPTRLRPVCDVITRETWMVCDHDVWWRLRSPDDRSDEEL